MITDPALRAATEALRDALEWEWDADGHVPSADEELRHLARAVLAAVATDHGVREKVAARLCPYICDESPHYCGAEADAVLHEIGGHDGR